MLFVRKTRFSSVFLSAACLRTMYKPIDFCVYAPVEFALIRGIYLSPLHFLVIYCKYIFLSVRIIAVL